MIAKLQYISQGKTPQEHLKNIQSACASGAVWVQLRLKNLDLKVILETAKKARVITRHFNAQLIINDHYKIAKEVDADGVHLGKKDGCLLQASAYLGPAFIIGGTANTLEDCKKLLAKKVDYIGLGPYQFTETKKQLSPVLGIAGYTSLLENLQTKTPIIAIGGIGLDVVGEIIKTGVYGIALSGAITKDFKSIPIFNGIINTLNT
ncbi:MULTISPECIES: thiamine phosphate synthase [unclassified Polaribacter]|uniref:thiamine phosphate synthase n=1 Tax=unclassified Polaribacter TaxID=196858 RepID=UPI0011BE6E4E|nr:MULTISPECIES: thiamine phosphate synthase [unclassified Polaribacter]TXD52609.1 thiamine phosphate synthase [Polaribacter sp. IC063]TXD61829.1 thiamine phosphate synthase [Polaribacter sp. IC066]